MVVAQFLSYREMVWRLRQFEPHRYLLQVRATWLILLDLMTTSIVAIDLNAYVDHSRLSALFVRFFGLSAGMGAE
jgi:hypothetical protein